MSSANAAPRHAPPHDGPGAVWRGAASGLALAAFFAIVWLPLGQTAFLAEHWMKIGAYLAPILVFLAFKTMRPGEGVLTDVTVMALMMAAAYLVHQCEEHWVDLLGRPYPLYDVLNSLIADRLGAERYGVMTPTAIFYINSGLVWTVAFIAVAAGPGRLFPALAMAGLMLVNGVAHLGQALAASEYNPGLLTGAVLFPPLAILFFRAAWKSGRAGAPMLLAAVAWGVLSHVILFAGIVAANVYGLIPVAAYYAILIAWGAAPVLVR